MKPREVELKLKVLTDTPLAEMRTAHHYNIILLKPRRGQWYTAKVIQAQANVVEPWDVKEVKHAPVR